MTDMWWATTSWSSRAILVRSSSRARRARSVSLMRCCSASRRWVSRRPPSAPAATRTMADRVVISARSGEALSPGMRWTRIAPAPRVSSHSSTSTRGRACSPTRASTPRWASRLGSAHTGPAPPALMHLADQHPGGQRQPEPGHRPVQGQHQGQALGDAEGQRQPRRHAAVGRGLPAGDGPEGHGERHHQQVRQPCQPGNPLAGQGSQRRPRRRVQVPPQRPQPARGDLGQARPARSRHP